jgi:predicted kinase
MVGPSIAENSEVARLHFLDYEIINVASLIFELTGGSNAVAADNNFVLREAYRRAAVKLSLGERVVINATQQLK